MKKLVEVIRKNKNEKKTSYLLIVHYHYFVVTGKAIIKNLI
jgi:hypothetical protein